MRMLKGACLCWSLPSRYRSAGRLRGCSPLCPLSTLAQLVPLSNHLASQTFGQACCSVIHHASMRCTATCCGIGRPSCQQLPACYLRHSAQRARCMTCGWVL